MESSTLSVISTDAASARRGRRAERLLVLMDDSLLRAVVLASLETATSLEVVAVTGSEAEAIQLLGERRLDIVLVDGEADRLPAVVHRVEALAAASSARIVCFVSSGDARRIGALLQAGAESCVATSVAPDDLAAVVREASRGTIFHAPPAPAGHVPETPATIVSGLTARELEVLTLAAEGLANKQIAQRLRIAEDTVKQHASAAYAVLGVSSRTQAMTAAARRGIRSE